MDKKPKNSTCVVEGAQQTDKSEYNPEQMNIHLGSHRYHREPYQEMLGSISRNVSGKNTMQIPWNELSRDHTE